ncbi:putative ABC transport system ATP-binding protein [Metabacillus crassostreae]|uniref:ABC transporter ATP-binding protein n=1 Tax=Metabacillus crassostreae TaxID=929098 RepID=UPI001956A510|nr:ABC transporter ATP-binding protein [Metabacillus crassostreae]MBM7604170.1 putative ABC transport system ATP-binding protein [Metabacillus crassostreae]
MLQLDQIYKVFNEGSVDEKIALNSLNLSLNEGDFVTVIGSNGAGKSTLLNVIAGRITPDDGDVLIKEKSMIDVQEYKRSRYIGRVFQDPMAGTSPTLTIEENLAIAYSRVHKRTLKPGVTSKRRLFFKEQLEMLGLGLENRLSAKVGLLSGGERQALSLLMATFTKPDILLLDEHTAALDPSRAELITNLTKKLVEKGNLTTLMITHNMQQAVDLGNRLIMMDSGNIVFQAEGKQKEGLTVSSLLEEFSKIKSDSSLSDKALLI